MEVEDLEVSHNYTDVDLASDSLNEKAIIAKAQADLEYVISFYYTAKAVEMYYAPLLCTFGILGNSLSLLVFCMDYNYRQQSSSYYLCALALSDSAYLLNYFRIWMINHLEVGLPANNFTCKLETYLFQVIRFTSGYITVTFSLERYIAIQYPFSRPRICTRSNAKKAIAVVASTAMLFFSYTWLISELVLIPVKGENCNQTNLTTCDNITYGICSYPDHYHRISEMVTYVDSVVTVLIPFVLITYFNGRIAAIVLQMNRDRKKILASANTSAVATAGPNNRTSTVTMHSLNARVHQSQTGIEMMQSGIQTAHNPSNDRLEQAPVTYHQRQQPQSSDVRVTKALLLVSTVFLVLTLPAHAIRGIRFILEQIYGSHEGVTYSDGVVIVLLTWAQLLLSANFAVNFLLYCLSGSNFRKTLRKVISRILWNRQQANR